MQGASFVQVLDRLIDHFDCATIERANVGRRRPSDPSVTTAPIGGAPYLHRWGHYAVKPGTGAQRLLTPAMRAALEVLRSAGAIELADDFVPAELKAAFRRLARSAHPDMHPYANEHDQRCLVARFREIREAYQTLQSCPS